MWLPLGQLYLMSLSPPLLHLRAQKSATKRMLLPAMPHTGLHPSHLKHLPSLLKAASRCFMFLRFASSLVPLSHSIFTLFTVPYITSAATCGALFEWERTFMSYS